MHGIKFTKEKHHLKIIKYCMVVAVGNGELVDNLYRLIGKILMEKVIIATGPKPGSSTIWCRHLGQMSKYRL